MIAETVDIQVQLQEKWTIFYWAFGIGLLALCVAWRQGFFRPFQASPFPVIRGVDVLKGFLFFLFIELFLIPFLIGLAFSFSEENLEHFIALNPQAKGWFNLLIAFGGFFAVFSAYLELTTEQRHQFWQQAPDPWYWNIGIGIAAWFVSYPLVLAFSQVVSIAVWHVFHHSFIEQIAVQHLRHAMEEPLLFGASALAVTTLVPFTEEFLFRGLLQSWLKHRFHHTPIAIGMTSVIFAIFHYSSTQGVTNIELLSSLFILSCVLGFIYERQRSLWAPIGLHGFFNLMSVLMIFKEP